MWKKYIIKIRKGIMLFLKRIVCFYFLIFIVFMLTRFIPIFKEWSKELQGYLIICFCFFIIEFKTNKFFEIIIETAAAAFGGEGTELEDKIKNNLLLLNLKSVIVIFNLIALFLIAYSKFEQINFEFLKVLDLGYLSENNIMYILSTYFLIIKLKDNTKK